MASGHRVYKRTVVLKIGGSIFREPEAYRKAARFIGRQLRAWTGARYVTVVSAQNGTTDAQQRVAKRIVRVPHARALDLFWATGELRSVALLTMHLPALDVRSVSMCMKQDCELRVPQTATTASNSTEPHRDKAARQIPYLTLRGGVDNGGRWLRFGPTSSD